MTLSILICSLESRQESLRLLCAELSSQYKPGVEILAYVDNKQFSTGYKRQALINEATGKYIIFIDDDDWVEPYYIEELLKAAESDADCFAINGWITTNGKNRVNWKLSKNYKNETRGGVYLRTTNHITAVKRELALQVGFPDKSNAEDKWYSDRVVKLLKTEYTIKPPMYHYRFSTLNKEY